MKFDNDISEFFVSNSDKKVFLFQYLLESVHSYTSLHFIWTIARLDWWNNFVKLHSDTFLSTKSDSDMNTFFIANPGQKFFLFQNLLGWVHSYSSPLFIWTSSWLNWRTLFVKLHTDTFLSAKLDNNMSEFFVSNSDKKIFLFQYLLESVHSYTSRHFIWTIPRLDWWNTFCETAYRNFFEHKA